MSPRRATAPFSPCLKARGLRALPSPLSDGGAPFAQGGRLLLLVFNLDEPEAVAERKGSIRRLLDEKWANAYKMASPRGLFALHEQRRARRGPLTALGGGEGKIGPLIEVSSIATCTQRVFNSQCIGIATEPPRG